MATQNLKLKCKALSLFLMLKVSMRTSVTLCHQTLMGFGLKTLFGATYCLLASIPQAQSLTTAPVLSRGGEQTHDTHYIKGQPAGSDPDDPTEPSQSVQQ